MKIRTQFTLFAGALVLALTAAMLAALVGVERRRLVERQSEAKGEEAVLLARVAEEALAGDDDALFLNTVRAWRAAPGAARAALVDASGAVYLDSALLDGRRAAVGKPYAKPAPDSRALFEVPVRRLRRPWGTLAVEYDAATLRADVEDALFVSASRFAAIGGVVFVLGLLGAWLLARRLHRPLEDLAEAVREIAQGRFTTEVAVRRRDEIGFVSAELNAMAKKLGELEALKEKFMQSVSHEMRAPLAAMQHAAEHGRKALAKGIQDGLADDFADIERGVERLARFVRDILDLAKLESGQLALRVEPTPVKKLLDAARVAFTAQSENLGLRLEVDTGEHLKPVACDAERVHQVLSNLLLNAMKFTPRGGHVGVAVRAEGAFVRFTVADSGPGIPQDARARLFTRFSQLGTRRQDGRSGASSGLGLAIAREIVERHGGSIGAGGEEGRGADFWFTLPYA